MSKIKKFFSNWKILLYLVFFLLTLLAINPNPWNEGATIRSVALNSTAYDAGMISPAPTDSPMSRERIIEVNRIPVSDQAEFERIIGTIPSNTTLTISTEKLFKGKNTYSMVFQDPAKLGLTVYDAPKSNIILGLDLQGGTRVVLQPEEKVSQEDMNLILDNINRRINLYGLTDTVVRSAGDLAGNQFIIIEVAGANEEEVRTLLAKQGKFEAKIGNETVFLGGRDITYVCRTAECSGIDPQYGCGQMSDGYSCRFRFSITLSTEAAQRQADVTSTLDIDYSEVGQAYLSQPIDLYLDDVLVDTLRIGAELKGNPVTDISISGSGVGRDRRDALMSMQANMKQLQTVLVTGSLPVKLEIIKTDTLSPSLGREFLVNALWIAILSEIAVTLVVIFRYRQIKVALPIITVITSEILLILGISALFKQNLDIAGIAGIIVAIGTGVDDQIVITDEILGEETEERKHLSLTQKINKAFFIVFATFLATGAAMVPLLFAGAGLLKGFAVTTLIGITNGVFITRPAFSEMMKILLEKEE
jgi:preprotein translocase subunit SecD